MPRRTVTRTTYETLPAIVTVRGSRRSLPADVGDVISNEILSRRHDQQIKNDLTNKLYRLELESVKPSNDVRHRTSQFRSAIRRRHYTPEPITRSPHPSRDFRRYSVAAPSELYRSPYYHVIAERAEPLKVEYTAPYHYPLYHSWSRYNTAGERPREALDEYQLRREAELRVKSRAPTHNGPLTYTTHLTYPFYSTTVEPFTDVLSRPSSAPRAGNNAGRALKESQNDLAEFEGLMKKTFGPGGVSRTGTPLYTGPPYYYPYYYSSPYYSYNSSLPAHRGYYGNGYYGNNYLSPYYRGACVSTLDTLPDYYVSRPYSYTVEKPTDYDYLLYSPPTRVTGPGGYSSYYDPVLYGYDRYPLHYRNYYTYTR